jgi:DNA-binding transcriptional MerR regulator
MTIETAGRPWTDSGAPLFSVGQAADMLGVEQAFLRRLDSHGLVSPARTDGRQRRYSGDDLTALQGVMALVDEGLTLAGVRRVLELQAEVDELKATIRDLKASSVRR